MTEVKKGDKVSVHYTGKLDDGLVFDTTDDRDPVVFTVGEGRVIDGFEEAVLGMNPGESKTVKVSPDKAYGEHKPDLIGNVDRNKLPKNLDLNINKRIKLKQKSGKLRSALIVGLSDSQVTLDVNHPLAGKDLVFDIKLLEIL
jgi:FKBP-type peptidyl-prolyl cis-trans isomerase 2